MKKYCVLMIILFISSVAVSNAQTSDDYPVNEQLNLSIAGKTGGPIYLSELIEHSLVLNDEKFTVTSFLVEYIHSNGDISDRVIKGDKLSQRVIDELDADEMITRFFFTNVLATGDDGSIWKVRGLAFTIER